MRTHLVDGTFNSGPYGDMTNIYAIKAGPLVGGRTRRSTNPAAFCYDCLGTLEAEMFEKFPPPMRVRAEMPNKVVRSAEGAHASHAASRVHRAAGRRGCVAAGGARAAVRPALAPLIEEVIGTARQLAEQNARQ